jgi:4-oxalocrotonate tautomerase
VPYVKVEITKEGATDLQKAAVIKGVTDVLSDFLGKDPATTFVVIDEVALPNWGIGGLPVSEYRAIKRPDRR